MTYMTSMTSLFLVLSSLAPGLAWQSLTSQISAWLTPTDSKNDKLRRQRIMLSGESTDKCDVSVLISSLQCFHWMVIEIKTCNQQQAPAVQQHER